MDTLDECGDAAARHVTVGVGVPNTTLEVVAVGPKLDVVADGAEVADCVGKGLHVDGCIGSERQLG